MEGSTRSTVIAAITIVVVAVVATTIESTVVSEPSGQTGLGGDGDRNTPGLLSPQQNATSPGETLQIPFLPEILLILSVLAVFALLVYLYVHWRTALKTLVGLVAVATVLYVLFAVLGSFSDLSLLSQAGSGDSNLFTGGGIGDSESTDQPTLSSILLLLVLLGVLFGTIAAYLNTSSADAETDSEPPRQHTVEMAAVGDTARRVADRIERETIDNDRETIVDNEVYRAWDEMTALLDVSNPEASTPEDFAGAAIEAGMDQDDVRELTRLFEDVRYGNAAPSTDRERRAIGIFRRIESRYTGGDP